MSVTSMYPHTTVILAMSLDGKIADYQGNPARFGSEVDKLHLEEQISTMDAVLLGAETLRAYQTSLPITDPILLEQRRSQHKTPQPIHIICSPSGNLDPQWRFFQQPIPRWLLTTSQGKNKWDSLNCEGFEHILTSEIENLTFDWPQVFLQLLNKGIKKLGVLGGSYLITSLVEANLIDEWCITLCPLILGGENAPSPVSGQGWREKYAHKLQLISVKPINNEIFLRYRREV